MSPRFLPQPKPITVVAADSSPDPIDAERGSVAIALNCATPMASRVGRRKCELADSTAAGSAYGLPTGDWVGKYRRMRATDL